jgi:uncharacterized protein (DUF488 family)
MPVAMAAELLTVGHGTLGQAELTALLVDAGVQSLVDVRIAPGSRRHPHVGRAALAEWLPAAGVAYRWEQRLGGFRKAAPDSPDTALRNDSFRGYAGYMRTDDFGAALAAVLAEADLRPTVVMCSETLWWRCHRRLIADHVLLVERRPVRHLMANGRPAGHRATDGVRVVDHGLVYDAADQVGSTASR